MALKTRRGAAVPADAPFALMVEGPHGPVVHAANPAAEAAGVHPGLRMVDARAVCSDLRAEEADPRGDRAALLDLALWSRRWCPWTTPERTGIAMDVTGSTHLWDGEPALLREIEARLGRMGLSVHLAIAPTRGAAWALARFGSGREVCGASDLAARVALLPVRALRIREETALLLRRLGLRTVGDLAVVPRLPLARRFARAEPKDNPLLRLDQMMGRVPEPLPCPDEPPRFLARAALSEPVLDPTPLLPSLAGELCSMLAAKGFGARRLALTVFRSDGAVSGVEAATARATRDPRHLVRLFEGRLETLDPGFGFDLVTLGATLAEPLSARQPSLDGQRDEGEDLARLVDRLGVRFGPRALSRPAFRESHVPERREAWVPALDPSPPAPPVPQAPRPLRLFDPPEEVRVLYAVPEGPPAQFIWRRVTHRVTRFAGPERIAPEWWRDRPGTRLRDYYRVEDHEGRRFWLFREGLLGDGRGAEPRWYVQGAFG
ncbi:DNA polymerase Y family protein [Rubellimicrobium rubrum]|uniref:DNA polymerase Y family protein n=1 Tax=Rubellimicrobium rubrum TaxID=2585369 RepID=A0A5C4MXD9_9RHOB|nr:DNA polymerase Y family protein [Rubellimicrobium rubrum]TNC50825.1 DNA polymerase Y family protein [Rubellimicrobium rubrum]